MTRWYSPQLKRELVSELYFRAKAEGVAMTTLVNRIVQTALNAEEALEQPQDKNKSESLSTKGS